MRFTLDEVRDADEATLKRRIAQAKLIVVQSTEIDDAGEAGVGVQTFERALRDIEAVCRRLQSAGVRHIVLTADHGFLLQDETTQVRPYGKATDPDRRRIYADELRAESGLMPVSMATLGYEGVSGYLLFREDTAVFATKTSGGSFVHGGNSLQERVIEVFHPDV